MSIQLLHFGYKVVHRILEYQSTIIGSQSEAFDVLESCWDWRDWKILMCHAHALLQYSFTTDESPLQHSRLLCPVALYDQEHGRYEEALRTLLEVLTN